MAQNTLLLAETRKAETKKAAVAPEANPEHELHELLKQYPGAEDILARYQWTKAFTDKNGARIIPAKDGSSALKLVDLNGVNEACGLNAFGCAKPGEMRVLATPNAFRANFYAEWLPREVENPAGCTLRDPKNPRNADTLYVAAQIHEEEHQRNIERYAMAAAFEWRSHRRERSFLEAHGIVQPFDDDRNFRKLLRDYDAAEYALGVIDRYGADPHNSQLTDRLRDSKLIEHVEGAIRALRQQIGELERTGHREYSATEVRELKSQLVAQIEYLKEALGPNFGASAFWEDLQRGVREAFRARERDEFLKRHPRTRFQEGEGDSVSLDQAAESKMYAFLRALNGL